MTSSDSVTPRPPSVWYCNAPVLLVVVHHDDKLSLSERKLCQKMHVLYTEKCEGEGNIHVASEWTYRRAFKEHFNLSFRRYVATHMQSLPLSHPHTRAQWEWNVIQPLACMHSPKSDICKCPTPWKFWSMQRVTSPKSYVRVGLSRHTGRGLTPEN